MRFVDEYNDPIAARQLAEAIRKTVRHPWNIMEVCGGQTHTILKSGLQQLLPPEINLIHGPGCPVCVTPIEIIDRAINIALQPKVIFCSFGDMLRVPGSKMSLLDAKARGARVQIVYSPLDALKLAKRHPDHQVVFFAVGFETTAPANAAAVKQAALESIDNFSMLVAHVLVPPAMEAILNSPNCCVHGFLAAGHVCTVMGYTEYEPIARKYRVPIVVTGFEPLDLLQGIHMVIKQLEEGRAEVENQYTRSVRREGNRAAQELIREVFEIAPRTWRGLGKIPASGLRLRGPYQRFDAALRFPSQELEASESNECIAGSILQGMKKPPECPSFGTRCTPEHPLGAPMVSSEGACAAYFHYRRH